MAWTGTRAWAQRQDDVPGAQWGRAYLHERGQQLRPASDAVVVGQRPACISAQKSVDEQTVR